MLNAHCKRSQKKGCRWKQVGWSICVLVCILLPMHNAWAEEGGRKSDQCKIVGGTTAEPGAWPWMAAVLNADESDLFYAQYCGGALIAEKWVLTAAHCMFDDNNKVMRAAQVDVAIGVHDLRNDTGERIRVQRIVLHPDYSPITNDSDLALLELSRASTQSPLPLFREDDSLAGGTGTLIGWGARSATPFPHDYAQELQEVTVPIVSNTDCEIGYPGEITANMICAGYAAGGKDSCQGDSGGPLMVYEDGVWQHAGIVSWGKGCAEPYLFGVNTRTSNFVSFIESYTGPLLDEPLQGQVGIAPIQFLLLQSR
ncbi:MAG: hypothetical protein CSA33_04205 [Desulfobulbus propionicus]|nr:MAG: hypothetical protein CSA33_04205 [Desulfobulbus propionicus]